MKVLTMYPPNFREIQQAFNVRGQPVIFAYGSVVYNPSKIRVPEHLLIHERVHLHRQGDDPADWWRRYIDDPRFRLDEEIPAHVAEYRAMKVYDGPESSRWLDMIAERLASPLYGSLIDRAKARALLVEQTREHSTAITGQ